MIFSKAKLFVLSPLLLICVTTTPTEMIVATRAMTKTAMAIRVATGKPTFAVAAVAIFLEPVAADVPSSILSRESSSSVVLLTMSVLASKSGSSPPSTVTTNCPNEWLVPLARPVPSCHLTMMYYGIIW